MDLGLVHHTIERSLRVIPLASLAILDPALTLQVVGNMTCATLLLLLLPLSDLLLADFHHVLLAVYVCII